MAILYKRKKYKLQGGGFLKTTEALKFKVKDAPSLKLEDYILNPKSNKKESVKDYSDVGGSYKENVPGISNFTYEQDATKVQQEPRLKAERGPNLTEKEAKETGLISPVFSLQNNPELVEQLNKVAPGRFSREVTSYYDQYDDQILSAVNELRAEGEVVDPNVIKSVMLIETGMMPRRNKLGYEGFPQTKAYVVEGINNKYGTKFTMDDMYNPKKASKFIHYYLKDVNDSMYVNNLMDSLTAYNWGVGNLKKLKRGERTLPEETSTYLRLANILLQNK